MKRKFIKHPVCAASRNTSLPVSVQDVLDVVRNHNEFLLETEDSVYMTDPSAATFPGVVKITHPNIAKTIRAAFREWGDATAQEIVDDFIFYYATNVRVSQIVSAYQSVGEEVPEWLLNREW